MQSPRLHVSKRPFLSKYFHLPGIEIVEKKRAVLFQMILLNCYTCGLIVMPAIAWAVPYWRHFLRVIYAPTLVLLTYSFFLDESIRWLFSKGSFYWSLLDIRSVTFFVILVLFKMNI